MPRSLILFFILTLFSCSSKRAVIDENINIIIEDAQSCRYDLKKQTLTIFNISKPDTTINFNLPVQANKQILEKYYDLGLNKLEGKQTIQDECMIMPKLYTRLITRSGFKIQEITIDEDCKNYTPQFSNPGQRVARFLLFVRKILGANPAIKNAPKSDIIYL